jgi:DNA-binding MarR family transcriptional regulator
MAVSNRDVTAVQRLYPRIYLACHTQHHRRASNSARLTAHESGILAHLSETVPMRASELARHLGVQQSTMSAALKRLTRLGYVARARDQADRRAARLLLSLEGVRAMQTGSVLETSRVQAMLARLRGADRKRAIDGLALLADAAMALPKKRWIDR